MTRLHRITLLLAAAITLSAAVPRLALAFADTCNAQSDFAYRNPQNFFELGSIVRIYLTLGAGQIQNGTQVRIDRVRFELDCDGFSLPCPGGQAAAPLIAYVGNMTSTCAGTTWSANSSGGVIPNQIVFTANPGIAIPANTGNFCTLEFDVRVNAYPAGSGTTINQIAGFLIPDLDAICDTPGRLGAGNQSTGQFHVCNCDDGNACTDDSCDPAAGCVHGPALCECYDSCSTPVCDPVAGCGCTPPIVCDDQNPCTDDRCDAVTGGCTFAPNALPCNDGDACTFPDTCAGGACRGEPLTCDDGNACTADSCDPALGCVYRPISCDDGDLCTDDSCDPGSGCVYVPNEQCSGVCRSPGYWATHSSTKSSPCSDVTGAVVAMGGGSLNICGECLTDGLGSATLGSGNAASATEALCVAVKGQQSRQLARQLTAAALNCIVSGSAANCAGSPSGDVFSLCNEGCSVTVGNAPGPLPNGFNMGWCISALDCLNNGLGLPTADGCGPMTGCHDRELPWDAIPRPAGCHGSAPASPDSCQAAKGTACGILPFDEMKCNTDGCP